MGAFSGSELLNVESKEDLFEENVESCVQALHSITNMDTWQNDALYMTLYEELPYPLVTLDLNGFLVACNSSFITALGQAKSAVIGTHISGILERKFVYCFSQFFISCLNRQGVQRGNLSIKSQYIAKQASCYGGRSDSNFHSMEVVHLLVDVPGTIVKDWNRAGVEEWLDLFTKAQTKETIYG